MLHSGRDPSEATQNSSTFSSTVSEAAIWAGVGRLYGSGQSGQAALGSAFLGSAFLGSILFGLPRLKRLLPLKGLPRLKPLLALPRVAPLGPPPNPEIADRPHQMGWRLNSSCTHSFPAHPREAGACRCPECAQGPRPGLAA